MKSMTKQELVNLVAALPEGVVVLSVDTSEKEVTFVTEELFKLMSMEA